MRPAARQGLTAFAIGAGYFASIALGLMLRSSPDGSAILWIGRAFLVTVLLLLPRRHWWLVAAAAAAAR